MNAKNYMADRGLTGFKRCAFVGEHVVTNESPEEHARLYLWEGGRRMGYDWTPPAGAKCWMVWIRGETPEPLATVWTQRGHNPATLEPQWGWSAEEYPDAEDWKFQDSEAAAISMAVQAMIAAEE